MSKKIINSFYENLTFEKLLQAHYRAKKHKCYKPEIIKFEMNLEHNILNLLNNIKNGKYKCGNYFCFKVYDPKERTIKALPYIDRIVHQWYIEEFIKPYIVPCFIFHSYACLHDKGTHKAVLAVQNFMRIFKRNFGNFWILKCDIKKFFDNINPFILFAILSKYIKDANLLNFTKLLIFSDDKTHSGIPIRKLY